MNDDSTEDMFSRRQFLGTGSAALATAAMLSVADAAALDQKPNQGKENRSASDSGPANPLLDAQNSDSTWPLATDSKSLVQTSKYPFPFANKRTYEGGWSREITVRGLAVSKSLAGVNRRLTAGGVREPHWHTADEWAFVLYGNAWITAIDRDGKSFVADVQKDDLWYFPSGIPHSIQGLAARALKFAPVEVTLIERRNSHLFQPQWILCLFVGLLARSSSAPLTSLEKALSSFRQELTAKDATRVRIVVAGRALELDPAVQDQLFLVLREALINALRHSQAANIEVEIEYLSARLRAAVRDNGIGIDPELLHDPRKSHAGLTGMRERAEHIGAQFRLWSKAGAGVEVEISLPI